MGVLVGVPVLVRDDVLDPEEVRDWVGVDEGLKVLVNVRVDVEDVVGVGVGELD
jgi:hypothetical protein